jgi:hypothetical protein
MVLEARTQPLQIHPRLTRFYRSKEAVRYRPSIGDASWILCLAEDISLPSNVLKPHEFFRHKSLISIPPLMAHLTMRGIIFPFSAKLCPGNEAALWQCHDSAASSPSGAYDMGRKRENALTKIMLQLINYYRLGSKRINDAAWFHHEISAIILSFPRLGRGI